jgi:hypothetical protein
LTFALASLLFGGICELLLALSTGAREGLRRARLFVAAVFAGATCLAFDFRVNSRAEEAALLV